jgi:hypothetical protein
MEGIQTQAQPAENNPSKTNILTLGFDVLPHIEDDFSNSTSISPEMIRLL